MAPLGSRRWSGMPQWQWVVLWVVLCLFLLFAFMMHGAGRVTADPSDLAAVQISSAHSPSADHLDHPCNPGNRQGNDHIQCHCTFGPGCSSFAVIGEPAVGPADFRTSPFLAQVLPLVGSEAVSHFRPPRSLASV